MVSYNDSNVVQCLRQYDMFANSLNLVKTREEKDMIIKQLTKLENKIIQLTNEIYEEEYNALANKECGLIEDEQDRLGMLIELINQRLSYVEKRCNNHYQLTGDTIDISDVLGANSLNLFEERIKIIDKYDKNIKLEKELNREVESLNNKISLASEKIDINRALNQELERSFIKTLEDGFSKCGFYSLLEVKDDIEYAYYETEKSLTMAELNLETAKVSPLNLLNECQEMLDDVKKDYAKYKEKVNLLKLMDVFNREVQDYDDLLSKRKEVNELFRYIKNEDFLNIVIDVVTKQYNTILMEQQDVNTYEDLIVERDRKLEALDEINVENNSDKFQEVLRELIRNEETRQARLLEEQKRIEEEEKKRQLELERKKQEEILKRQKIIEEARKKEMEKRTKELLEQQQNSILQPKKRENGFSFETIKDISNKQEDIVETVEKNDEEKQDIDSVIFKDKIDIEKELFDEFNNETQYTLNFDDDDDYDETDDYEEITNKKLPDVSLDEYMKNFDESDVEENEIGTLFDDDFFPNIPV